MARRSVGGWTLTALLAVPALAGAPAFAQEGIPEPVAPDPPPPSPPRVVVGMGENTVAAFDDPRFLATGIRHARLIVPYDVVSARGPRLADTDAWLAAARRLGVEPLVSFGFSQRRARRWHLPGTGEYGARVREFRERSPWVREYATWNEANHKKIQPTGSYPRHTASLYRELRRQCRVAGCTAVAVDVLLTGSRRTWRWIRSFWRGAGPERLIWGLHNYPDANRRSSALTRRFLRAIPGEVWFTETGGIVRFGRRWRTDELRAGRALRHAFALASLSPRVRRLYVYNWRADGSNRRWDSGLISPTGRPRSAYFALLGALEDERFGPKTPKEPREPSPPSATPPVPVP